METIFQAFSNTNTHTYIYKLKIEIGSYTFEEKFRVIEKSDLFDLLVGIDSLKRNRFILDFVNDKLYLIDNSDNNVEIAHLRYDIKLPTNSDSESEEQEVENQEDVEEINNRVPMLLTVRKNNNELEEIMEDSKSTIIDQEEVESKQDIIKKIVEEVPDKFKSRVDRIFEEYKEVLAIKTDDLRNTKILPHRINLLPGITPFKQKPYRLSRVHFKVLKEEINKLIKNKLIEPSDSAWTSPVILVEKKNGKYRLCIDYRKLNNCTIKDSYALPRIDEILYAIGNTAKILTTLDLFSGYHQVPMFEQDKDKTAFTTIFGNYEFNVMPFGLTNAPATFQREMNRIFFELIGNCIFIYIDDVIIFSGSFEKHLEDIVKVFKILRENNLKINIEKCHFFQKEVELLGHLLTVDGLKPVPTKVEVIKRWLPPKNITDVRSFLGAVGYYRKFIPNFAAEATFLIKLLKKNSNFHWGPEEDLSFQTLKDRLITAPVLSLPDYDKEFIIRTDASRKGIGGVLIQKDEDGNEHPLHFVSRTLKSAELNYSVTDLEGLAAFYCVKKFKHYICGGKHEPILITDHKPLVGFFKNTEPTSSRHTKWIIFLSSLKVKVKYEEGKKNVVADALSRLSLNPVIPNDKSISTGIELININSEVNGTSESNKEDNFHNNINIQNFIKNKIIEINGIKYYKQGDSLRRIVVNPEEKLRLLESAHNIGHEGIFKTYCRLKRDYYWSNMSRDVKL